MKSLIKNPWPWGIFGLALVLRILHWISVQQTLPQMPLLGDAEVFDQYAWKIAAGAVREQVVGIHLLPVYLAFLSALYKVAGHVPALAVWTQMLLGSLTCVLCYKLGCLLWNQKAGLIAGIIAACHGLFIFFDALLLRSSLINFLEVLLFYFLLSYLRRPKLRAVAFAGICLGTLVLLRTSFWFTVPGVIMWILISPPHLYPLPLQGERQGEGARILAVFRNRRTSVIAIGVFCLSLILTYQGWLFWFDRAIPKRDFLLTETGLQFYLGNNPTASGTYVPQKEFPPTIYGQSVIARNYVGAEILVRSHEQQSLSQPAVSDTVSDTAAVKHVQRESKVLVSLEEFDQYWFKRGKDFILQNPGRWLALEFKKLFLIFNAYEIPGSLDYDVLRRRSAVVSLPLFSFGLIAPLGLLGIFLTRDRWDAGASLLLIFSGLYLLTLLITYVQMDLRLPLQLPLILFAAFALIKIPELFASGQRRQLILAVFLFLFFWGVVNSPNHLPRAQFQKNAEALLMRI